MERRAFLLNNLRTYPDLSNLKRSAFFAECGREIETKSDRGILGSNVKDMAVRKSKCVVCGKDTETMVYISHPL